MCRDHWHHPRRRGRRVGVFQEEAIGTENLILAAGTYSDESSIYAGVRWSLFMTEYNISLSLAACWLMSKVR